MTTSQLVNGVRAVIENDSWATLQADRELVSRMTEKSLRQVSTVIAWRRITTQVTTIGETQLTEGSMWLLFLGGANRDPTVFPGPDEFNQQINNSRVHLSFRKGIHLCLGAHGNQHCANPVRDTAAGGE